MWQLFLILLLSITALVPTHAQLKESFEDGNFTQNPSWVGDASLFQVTASQQLQTKGPTVSGTTLQLATANTLTVGAQWEFYVQLNFATSASNYAEVHLISDTPELKGENGHGYFVRMGGTEDEVSLYRKDGSTSSKIINGPDKSIATSDNRFKVRVTRMADMTWTLELDVTGTGQNYVQQGVAQDSRYTGGSYFGVLCRYTQANAQRFYFDDFVIKDVVGASLIKIATQGARELELTFSEPISENEAKITGNYQLNRSSEPSIVEWSPAQPNVVRLRFIQDFETGNNTLLIKKIADLQGNVVENINASFNYAPTATIGDVRITEIYADQNPLQDLPAAEFIEIYNNSNKVLNLQGWQYSDATANAGTFPSFLLRPGAYVIVCAAADTALYKPYGTVVGLSSFPSLNDSGDEVELYTSQGQLIDKVKYSSSWYRDPAKDDGGWSLELSNVQSTCSGATLWRASIDPSGGTPGKANSIQANDTRPPVLTSARVTTSDKIVLTFDEPLDSVAIVQSGLFQVSPSVAVQQVRVLSPDFLEVELLLEAALKENERITITVNNLRDCAGNIATNAQSLSVIRPSSAFKGDVVINEILFNPKPNGVDFVEIVNRSNKYLDLQGWKIATRNTLGEVASARVINTPSLIMAPGQYLVLTTDPAAVLGDYPAGKEEAMLKLSTLPSFNDASGNVVLLLPNDSIMDEVVYREEQHFSLIRNPEGVSLERIQLTGPSVEANFHSAATQLGATPGYVNSQAQHISNEAQKLTLQPQVFTPDGDGVDDALLLQFHLPQSGYVGTITVFDASGRNVRRLISNQLLGTETVVQWNGLTDNGTKAAIGYYILLVELFDQQGRKELVKQTCVVGGRF